MLPPQVRPGDRTGLLAPAHGCTGAPYLPAFGRCGSVDLAYDLAFDLAFDFVYPWDRSRVPHLSRALFARLRWEATTSPLQGFAFALALVVSQGTRSTEQGFYRTGLMTQVEGVRRIVHEVHPSQTATNPNSAPAPGGAPLLSNSSVATCVPPGVVSTTLPSPPLVVRMCPSGASARPSGPFSDPFSVTVRPVPAEWKRNSALSIAAMRLFKVSATYRVPPSRRIVLRLSGK